MVTSRSDRDDLMVGMTADKMRRAPDTPKLPI
jgi:hypothetical protein